MEGLSDQDRAGNGQVVLAGDQRSTAEVGGSADALKDGREGDEAPDILVGEVVSAGIDRSDVGSLQGAGEKHDMLLLIVGDVLEVGVVLLVVACVIVSVKDWVLSKCCIETYQPSRSPAQRTCPRHPCRRHSPSAQE